MSGQKTIEQVIAEEGIFASTTVGISMEPLLRSRRDTIIVERVTDRLKPNDVALYKRGNDYVLHRVIKAYGDTYEIRGDNCRFSEKGISHSQVIGKLTAFYRKGKYGTVNDAGYIIYSKLIRAVYPVKVFLWDTKFLLCKLIKSLKK